MAICDLIEKKLNIIIDTEHISQKTALLVMDMQNATINMLHESASIISSHTKAVQKACSNNISVMFVVIGVT